MVMAEKDRIEQRENTEDTYMADPPPYSTPRWVKVFALVAIVLVLLVLITMFIIGGDHGPGRHTPPGGAGDTPVTLVAYRL
jgi:hypothetical protein